MRILYWNKALIDNETTKNFLRTQFKGQKYRYLISDLKDIILGFKGPVKNLPELNDRESANVR